MSTQASDGRRDGRRALEDRLAAPMFWLAAAFLALLAAGLYEIRTQDELADWQWRPIGATVLVGVLVLWPLFLVEAVVRYLLAPRGRRGIKPLATALAVVLLPPARMATHSRTRPDQMWLPGMGWQQLDYDFRKTLERHFSGPMFFVALMILPVLVVEYFWAEAVSSYAWLEATLGISLAIIWLAFSVEFIVRLSAADRKLSYTFQHWIDLAVILLPMLEFMPFLRLLQATRLMNVQVLLSWGKYYRVYGLLAKGWRGLVLLQLIRRAFDRSPKAKLSRLKGHLEGKLDEIRELELEADYYRRHIQETEHELVEQGIELEETLTQAGEQPGTEATRPEKTP